MFADVFDDIKVPAAGSLAMESPVDMYCHRRQLYDWITGVCHHANAT